jgi:hypothetical protein
MSGLVIGLGFALSGGHPRQWGRLQWSRTTILMTLLIGLVVGLVVGLVFGFVYQFGLVVGLVVGLIFALLFGFGQLSTVATSPLDPRSLWHRERQFGVFMGLGVGIVYGLGAGLVEKLMHPTYGIGYWLGYGLAEGLVVGLGVGLVCSATWAVVLTSAQLRYRTKLRCVWCGFWTTHVLVRFCERSARCTSSVTLGSRTGLPERVKRRWRSDQLWRPMPGRMSSNKDADPPSVFS